MEGTRRIYVHAQDWKGYLWDGGYIERTDIPVPPSHAWRAVCIRRYNNLGYEVERISIETGDTCGVARVNSIVWNYKNGKPRWYMVDIDHGTMREYPILIMHTV